ncbi:MAG: CDP-alcohol phosphatidyltransferase family protein [Candidatus Peregrinibacteria bacterium]|nr:CDP-alcohol phosphatidyltransferase family protein [Candidatus Peregrinibacteria bacterium]
MISALGLLVLAGFVFYIQSRPLYALYFLILHVVLDALDGSLARYMKCDTDAGAIVDMVCDHTGMIIVTGTLMYQGLIQQNLGVAYILLYTLLVLLITTLNRLHIPLRFAIRTKYFLYVFVALRAIWGVNYFDTAIAIFIILMIAPTAIGLLKLSRYRQ